MRDHIETRIEPVVRSWGLGTLARRTTKGDLHLAHPERPLEELTPAAVLVPIVEHPGGLSVLLTERTAHLRDHAGQISFPGGRAEEGDRHPVATALREAEEEIGLAAATVEVVGCLDNYETGTGFLVVPVVGFVPSEHSLDLDAFEVADAFEVPLAFLLDRRNRQLYERRVGERRRRYYAYQFEHRFIWGATAGMIEDLVRRL